MYHLSIMLCLLLALNSVSQTEVSNSKVKVAILPFYSDDAKSVNDAFYQIFETDFTTVADSVEFTQNIFGNVPFNEWIFNLEANSLSKNYAQKNPFIYEGLSKDRIKLWKLLLMNSDYLIIGSPIGIEEQKGKKGKRLSTIFGMYSIFDLNEGKLIIQCEEHLQFESKNELNDVSPLIKEYLKCFKSVLL